MGAVDILWVAVMVSQRCKNWTRRYEIFELLVHAGLCVVGVCARQLILAVVRNQITRIDGPGELISRGVRIFRAGQGGDGLQSSGSEIIRSVASGVC